MNKSAQREQALQLRNSGYTYQAIQSRLHVAKSTVWRWLKAAGYAETQAQRYTRLKRQAQERAAVVNRQRRIDRTNRLIEQARKAVGALTARDLWLLGTALYWAEGAKQKPHNISQQTRISNSDPSMILLIIRWLRDCCAITADRVSVELYIHESANIVAALQFWSRTLQIPSTRIPVRLKRHRLSSSRRNTGANYVGLVRVSVARSADLNRTITGWIEGICMILGESIGESAKGKPGDFGSPYPGSSPGSPVFQAGADGSSVAADAEMFFPRRSVLEALKRLESHRQFAGLYSAAHRVIRRESRIDP